MAGIREVSNQMIKNLICEPLRPVLRRCYDFSVDHAYEFRLRRLGTNKKKILILGTIERSGTHYVKFLFANYLKVVGGNTGGPATPDEMNAMLPNNWHLAYLDVYKMPFGPIFPKGYRMPTPLLRLIGLDDLARSHALYQKYYWDESPVLHLYRNPLDYAVSYFHYMHKNRPDARIQKAQDPFEALEMRFAKYVAMYRSYKDAAKSGKGKILRISYEDIKCNPVPCLRMILRWLGIEPKEEHLEIVAANASIEKIQELENAGGVINPTATTLKGKFARDGSIGQWREHFTDMQLDKVRTRFRGVGINLDDFTLGV